MPRLKLSFLGQPHIELDHARVEFDTNKATALLAYLAVTAQRHTREALATLLWPEYEQGRALANLRRTLWTLNKAGLKPWLEVERETISLHPGDVVWLDVDEFRTLIRGCEADCHSAEEPCPACLAAWAKAADLYRGDFLAGFTLRDSPEFDDWQFFQAETLRREMAAVLQRLVVGHATQGDLNSAIHFGRRWLALDPLQEPAHRRLMELYARAGQRSAALHQYEECVRVLHEELGVPPEAETSALCERIRTGEVRVPALVLQGTQKEPVGTLSARPAAPLVNLPAQPTPFVGRQEELACIAQLLLDPTCRLLTLVGPGGIGKTRLAIEAAAAQTVTFAHGVCFVPLSGVGSGEYLVSALVTALGLPPRREGGDLQAQLLTFLGSRQILVVMDNFEHLVEDAPLLCDILSAAPAVKVLVTSRERLNLREEWVFEVEGMEYPALSVDGQAQSYSAVALFLQSAQCARVGFAPSANDVRWIVRICQLVEGMPLGIELAATWVRVLSCEEIAAEIERNLDFLATSLRDLPEGHRSLRAVFDSSLRLLEEGEKTAFAKLSVFQGGFPREAAQAVAGTDLGLLSALVDKSFVRRDREGRYSIHELLRQFGQADLERMPTQRDAAYSRHSQYYLHYLDSVEDGLKGPQQQAIVSQLQRDVDNVLLAWQWAVEHDEWAAVDSALKSLLIFYDTACRFHEGRRTFELAARQLRSRATTDEQQAVLGRIIVRQGVFAGRLACVPEARELLAQGLTIARQKGSAADASTALYYLGCLAHYYGDLHEGKQLLQESVDLCRPLGDPFATAISLNNLGSITSELGDYEAARRMIEESLAIKRELGDRRGVAFALGDLGVIALRQGDYPQARRLCEEGSSIMVEIGDHWAQPSIAANLIDIAYLLGDYAEAERKSRETLEALRRTDFATEWSQAYNQYRLARIYCATGRCGEARELLQQSEASSKVLEDQAFTAYVRAELALVEAAVGSYATAERCAAESLAVGREMYVPPLIAAALAALGRIAYRQGNYLRAQQHCREALAMFEAMGTRHEMAGCLNVMGDVARALKDYDTAGEHLGRAQAVADEIGAVPLSLEIHASRAELLLAKGQGMKLDEDVAKQIAELLQEPLRDARASVHTRDRAQHLLARLTRLRQKRG